MAGYAIHTPAGLSPAAQMEAADLGPSAVCADAQPDELARQVGLHVVEYRDVTDAFYRTSCAFNDTLAAMEPLLRAAEGDDAFEDERARKAAMRTGIERGLLRRCLLVALKR